MLHMEEAWRTPNTRGLLFWALGKASQGTTLPSLAPHRAARAAVASETPGPSSGVEVVVARAGGLIVIVAVRVRARLHTAAQDLVKYRGA
eukprot:4153850-Prorocentrum_lima.AAC.1